VEGSVSGVRDVAGVWCGVVSIFCMENDVAGWLGCGDNESGKSLMHRRSRVVDHDLFDRPWLGTRIILVQGDLVLSLFISIWEVRGDDKRLIVSFA